jgi:inosine-uridine nucleoside N-ribohydrolase
MLHDPSVMMAVIDPSLFAFREGPVRVEVAEGPFRALTLAYFGNKK